MDIGNSQLPQEKWWLNTYQHTTASKEKASEMVFSNFLILVTFLFFFSFQGHLKNCGIAGLFSFSLSLSYTAAFNIIPHLFLVRGTDN